MAEHFTHLHVHSRHTLLGGTASAADLVHRAALEGMTRLALTDTNVLYGAVAFERACREAGIQPILGMTVTVAWPEDLELPGGPGAAPGQLVLLAMGPEGYRSLCRLSSLIQGSPDRDALSRRGLSLEALEEHRDGLICVGGGRMGWVARSLRADDRRGAQRYAARLAGIYDDHTYLSLELHPAEGPAVAREIAGLVDFLGLPTVAVQPVYCLSSEDAPCLRLLAAIDHNCSLEDVPAMALPGGGEPGIDVHWLSRAEVAARFAGFPDALAHVGEVAARCRPALPVGRTLWPSIDLPGGQTPEQALTEQAHAGLVRWYGPDPAPEVRERLEKELAAINRHGFAPLFLVVADVVRFARQADIPVSTRGSVANSLVAYCTGITTVDPIAHDLLFERFLSPARAHAPDIDLDLCSRRRDEVLDYVRRMYGADRVALVATLSTLRPRSAVRETAKAYGLDEAQLEPLLAILPWGRHPDARRRDLQTVEDVLTQVEDPQLREIIRAAYTIVGQPHHLSVHPGGVVITPGPLTDVLPVQWAPKGFLITQFDGEDVEALGLPKIDLLGIRALTVLNDAAALVRRDHDPQFRLDAIPPDDPRTGDMLARGETIGVFQCESEGARRTLRKLRAHTIRDLAVANAFFKPGPATGGMADAFVRRYRGEVPVTFMHPALEPILGSTQGVLLFQEQILRVATEIAGLSWAQADHLRRGMSKMQPEEMARMQVQFEQGCQRPPPEGPGFTPQLARQLWEQVAPFSGYGFNQGHATAYADVSYRSAYLKAHWPAAFFCARLKNWGGYHHPAIYMAEAIRLGIAVRPPHVNHSERGFALRWEGDQAVLWMGLGQASMRGVRDLRRSAIDALLAARRERPFTDLRDLLARVPFQAKEIAHLIQCGALDGLGAGRAALLAEAEMAQRAGSAQQLAFDFVRSDAPAESLAQQVTWEKRVLGFPIKALQALLPQIAARHPDAAPLKCLPEYLGRSVTVIAVRLPGWSRGQECYLWDGETWVLAKVAAVQKLPPSWAPLCLRGRWSRDEWGMAWLQVDAVRDA